MKGTDTVTISAEEYRQLQDTVRMLTENAGASARRIAELEAANRALLEKLQRALRDRCKKSTEQAERDGDRLLDDIETGATLGSLDGDDPDARLDKAPSGQTVRSYTRRKARNASAMLPADTPVIVDHVPSVPGTCPECGAPLVKTGERSFDQVVTVRKTVILRTVWDVYGCPRCDAPSVCDTGSDLTKGCIVSAPMAAMVIVEKTLFGTPIYRQAMRDGGVLSYQTISASLMRLGNAVIDDLKPVLEEEVMASALINADETPVKVVGLRDAEGKPKAPGSRTNAFMIFRIGTCGDGSPGLVDVYFTDNRRNGTVSALFAGFGGVLQTDGLAGYRAAARENGFTHAGCLVHARRKAVEAAEGLTKGLACDMVGLYGKIFGKEAELGDALREGTIGPEEFVSRRRAEMGPLFLELKAFCERTLKGKVAPNKRLRTACVYFLERYDELTVFLDYPYMTSNNNIAENLIRGFALARKNFLFCATPAGAEVSALFFSLVLSCRNIGMDPTDYLTHLFLNAGGVRHGDKEGWRSLLPGRCDISDAVSLRERLCKAEPCPGREEPYMLRGKKL